MEELIFKIFAGGGPWAVLAVWIIWKFSTFNEDIMHYNRDREERLINDARDREERYGKCIQRLEDSVEKVAENQRILAEEISKLRESSMAWQSRI